jgi:hypothetical protein
VFATWVGAVGVAFAIGTAVLDSTGGSDRAFASGSRVQACLTPDRVDALREDPARTARVFEACRSAVAFDTRPSGIPRTEDAMRAVFATALAHRFAPYGTSTAISLEDLVREPALDCDNYIALAHHLYRQVGGTEEVQILGWDGGAVGNHAQIWIGDLLLDPTLGIAAVLPLERLFAGRPLRRLVDLSAQPTMPEYREWVVGSLERGEYEPGDILYWTDRFSAFATAGGLVDLEGELVFEGLPPGVVALRTSR